MACGLDITDLSLTFNPGQVNESKALRNLTLHVDAGEFVVIVGSNGAGKSTLMNVISGVHQPDTGTMVLGGSDLTPLADYQRARRIGRVYQDPLAGTAPTLTIEDNLALAAARGRRRRFRRPRRTGSWERELEALKMGLEHRLTTRVSALSGGQRQALSVLMSLQSDPDLLLLDEHTAALDPGAAERILEITQRLAHDRAITTLMVTHNMAQALEFGDRTVMTHQGSVLFELSGEQRRQMSVGDLIARFHELAHDDLPDRALLG